MVVFKETPLLLLIKGHHFKGHTMLLEGPSSIDCCLILSTPKYNEINKVTKKVRDIQKMMRKLKEPSERMVKKMSEYFAQLAMSNREIGTFPSQLNLNPKGNLLLLLSPMM